MLDVGALLELADFTCVGCGKPGADTFEQRAGLEAALSPGALVPNAGAQRMPRLGIGTVTPEDLQQFGPVHATCLREPRAPARPCPYDLLKSVS